MSFTNLTRKPLALSVLLALGGAEALAQDTSSGIRGLVTGPDGSPAANTRVVILHEPSNNTTEVVTNDSGRFTANGLRVGGPYKIVVDSNVYQDAQYEDIFLKLDDTFRFTAALQAGSLEEVVVTAEQMLRDRNSGTSSVFGADTIATSASMDRDIKDLVRMNPLAVVHPGSDSELSVAGMNPRFNSLTVDGISQNDDFGLNYNGYPTRRSPVSTQALEAISLDTTPYNVRASGFSGAQINAVTKSGDNDFHGSVFYETRSDSLGGTAEPDGQKGEKVDMDYEKTNWGATFSGPLMQDKLFFFTSYEKYESPTAQEWGPEGAGLANSVNLSEAGYDDIRAAINDTYSLDVGDWRASPQEEDEKLLIKLDWNISDDHRMSLTHQYTEGNSLEFSSSRSYQFYSAGGAYNKTETLQNWAVQVYSNWSDTFSSELSVNYKDVVTEQVSLNHGMPSIVVDHEDTDVFLGSDPNRHGNELTNERIGVEWVGELLMDDHTVSFGAKYDQFDAYNLYVYNANGTFEFDSLADVVAGNATVSYSNAYTNVKQDAAANLSMATVSLFAQDTWALSHDFEVTYGLRYETIGASEAPNANANFAATYGFSNQENLDGASILLPRIGFTWDVQDDLRVKGGVGRFSGGQPNVWLANSWSNDGVTYVSAGYNDYTGLTSLAIPADMLLSAADRGNGSTNVIDPNFDLPSDIRMSMEVEYQLPYEVDMSATYTYIKQENSVQWVDLAREQVGTTVDGGRKIYAMQRGNDYDLMLTNADDNGNSQIFTTSLFKQWDNGLAANFSYTNQNINEGTYGGSSTAHSNFRYAPTINRNEITMGTGNYQVEHRFVLNLNYNTELVDGYRSTFNLYMQRRSGKPFSWTLGAYRDDDLGDQSKFSSINNYLPYIPSGADDPAMNFDDGLSYNEIMEIVNAAGLAQYAGGYVPKNVGTQPWQTQMDLKFTQEIPGFMEGHRGVLEFTVHNVLDFMNDTGIYENNLGAIRYKRFNDQALVDYDVVDGQYIYDEAFGGTNLDNYDFYDAEASTWALKLGVRYEF
ncbi:TonB-dependent receptor [Simiduia aestuariiviva]|uniref:Outer membrane receptor for ferrienterochelin and colicin n=1 Tax=Simiduia aestuariiviva TaxID=1510459 RepID=A0A839UNT0_9GAMM|nr:TonB-dependent receptor [Simiduia aestuariiviva]MBB3169492.1 outer membrane receptor for ferrienterochelin and colicin [Simiduia aestuariiviva]